MNERGNRTPGTRVMKGCEPHVGSGTQTLLSHSVAPSLHLEKK